MAGAIVYNSVAKETLMGTQHDFPLPDNLPVPKDDGAAKHLKNSAVPDVSLQSVTGRCVNPSRLDSGRTVVYCYPMTGVPGKALPEGWDLIPGARGCTPQTCGFRDNFAEFSKLGAKVFGLSTQTTEYQKEMVTRLGVPFEVLSDADFKFCDALRLPTFEVDGKRLLRRLTMVLRNGKIEEVFYPVFPPNESASQVLAWLREHPL
jgi:peroxiredoxin